MALIGRGLLNDIAPGSEAARPPPLAGSGAVSVLRVTSPSVSKVRVEAPKRTMASYSLAVPERYSLSRVAGPRHKHQDPRGAWVEGAGVTDLSDARALPDQAHHGVGGRPDGLVHDDETEVLHPCGGAPEARLLGRRGQNALLDVFEAPIDGGPGGRFVAASAELCARRETSTPPRALQLILTLPPHLLDEQHGDAGSVDGGQEVDQIGIVVAVYPAAARSSSVR